jgi:hypothetical protein
MINGSSRGNYLRISTKTWYIRDYETSLLEGNANYASTYALASDTTVENAAGYRIVAPLEGKSVHPRSVYHHYCLVISVWQFTLLVVVRLLRRGLFAGSPTVILGRIGESLFVFLVFVQSLEDEPWVGTRT